MSKKLVISEFQKELFSKLKSQVEKKGGTLNDVQYGGKKEIYIEGEVLPRKLKFWIYDDSAEFTDSNSVDKRYEAIDFDTQDILMESFLSDLNDILQDTQ